MSIKRDQIDDEVLDELDDACQVFIGVARQNPNGCFAIVRALDAVTGEEFEIAVRRKPE